MSKSKILLESTVMEQTFITTFKSNYVEIYLSVREFENLITNCRNHRIHLLPSRAKSVKEKKGKCHISLPPNLPDTQMAIHRRKKQAIVSATPTIALPKLTQTPPKTLQATNRLHRGCSSVLYNKVKRSNSSACGGKPYRRGTTCARE